MRYMRKNGSAYYCVKSVRIWSFSGPYFPAFGLNQGEIHSVRMRENTEQKNSQYAHFSRSLRLYLFDECLSHLIDQGLCCLLVVWRCLNNPVILLEL